jgi:hypothetical protein
MDEQYQKAKKCYDGSIVSKVIDDVRITMGADDCSRAGWSKV